MESRDLFFREAKVVDNFFQLDVLKNMQQIKSYADMFQAIKGFDGSKNSQNMNLTSKILAK